MRWLPRLMLLATVSITVLAGIATASKLGAQDLEHPQGLSLRDESVRSGRSRAGGFFAGYYAGRVHRGGGPRSGK